MGLLLHCYVVDTMMSLPLPPDDPRQVRALAAIDTRGVMRGLVPDAREKIIAAYFSALQKEGVRFVVHEPESGDCVSTGGLSRHVDRASLAVRAHPAHPSSSAKEAVAAPPCKACEGTGKERAPFGWFHTPCPRCNGSGLTRMVALDDVEEWLGAAGWSTSTSPEYLADLFARRFSGTGEESH